MCTHNVVNANIGYRKVIIIDCVIIIPVKIVSSEAGLHVGCLLQQRILSSPVSGLELH